MKTSLVISSVLFFSSLFAQSSSSLDQIFNATSVALGEASVANTNYGIPSNINPALLSEAEDLVFYYNQRSITWMESLKEFKFLSAGVQIPTSYGSFAFNYKKFDQGTLIVGTFENPDGIGEMDAYDNTFELMYGRNITSNLSAGAALKMFNVERQMHVTSDNVKFNTPLFLDLGLTYKLDKIIYSPSFEDNLIIGIDVQNYGTDFIIINTHTNDPEIGGTRTIETVNKLPRFLRIGFGYNLAIVGEDNNPIFNFALNTEYKNQLNNIYNDKSSKDFWGMGMEATFFDIVSLRLGAIAWPFTSIYGTKGNFSARYGFGLQSPIINVITNLPFKIAFDYSVIPINYFSSYFSDNNYQNLDAFNVSFRFPGLIL